MKVKEIAEYMEKVAPSFLKESFDNVGLMVGDEEQEVEKILLALDCTKKVIEEAKAINADMIITHHPLLFKKPSSIVKSDLQGSKIFELIKNDISLYSSHTNLDSVEGGLNQIISEALGYNNSTIIDKNSKNDNAGIGRFIDLPSEITLQELINKVKRNLHCPNLRVVRGKETIKKIAIINGSGQDFFYQAMKMGADCIITGDTTYHYVSDFKELGISIIDPGHFNSEWTIFIKSLTSKLKELKGVEVVVASNCEDPYEFV
ncbi:MAG: Nif3-like dinuclear metal center hexameric protein [Clostridium sp.]